MGGPGGGSQNSDSTSTAGGAALALSRAMGQQADALLAPTPPMGWMSWNQFGPEVSDKLLREMADGRTPTVPGTIEDVSVLDALASVLRPDG